MSGSSNSVRALDEKRIMEAFEELEMFLKKERLRATLYMVGGSAMIIGCGSPRHTNDVDVLLRDGSAEVFRLAKVVARRLGLPNDWLNDSVRNAQGFPPREDKGALAVYNSPNLVVTSASRSHLIAMKAHAGRSIDMRDLRFLLIASDIRTLDEVRNVHKKTFPYDEIPKRNIERIQDVLNELTEIDDLAKG